MPLGYQQLMVIGHGDNSQAFVGMQIEQVAVVGYQVIGARIEGRAKNRRVVNVLGHVMPGGAWLHHLRTTNDPPS